MDSTNIVLVKKNNSGIWTCVRILGGGEISPSNSSEINTGQFYNFSTTLWNTDQG